MQQASLQDVGYRWTRPTWELIVPSQFAGLDEGGGTTDPRFDRSQRMYDVFEFDGSWLDQLHEMQIERILDSPQWRRALQMP